MKRLLRSFRGDVDGKVIKQYSDGSVQLEEEEDDDDNEDKPKTAKRSR